MKMYNVNVDSTIEELENDFWYPLTEYPTALVENIYLLRRKKISFLTSNDIRFLLIQNIGLKFLIPVSINFLRDNILLDSLYYSGDLLNALLGITESFWHENSSLKLEVQSLIKKKITIITESDLIDEEVKSKLIKSSEKILKL